MKRKIALILLCVVFLGMAGYAGLRLYRVWRENHLHDRAYEALAQHVQPADGERFWPVVDFEALQQINPDIVGWIYMEGTPINYPILQGPDNSLYLDKLYDGSYNAAGSLFFDYRNQADLSDRHTIVYGHHMKNETMLACITEYKEQTYYDTHPSCLIMTPEGNYQLQFVAGYVCDSSSDAWKLSFASDEEYTLWLEAAIANSTFTSTVTPTAEDRVVTLSTCSYEFPDARYVLIGILK